GRPHPASHRRGCPDLRPRNRQSAARDGMPGRHPAPRTPGKHGPRGNGASRGVRRSEGTLVASLYRNFLNVGALTLGSRVLGFIRDALVAAVLGTGLAADAYLAAFRFPNLFRRLFAEGAFNTAFIPLFAK